jgi:hypothetical protein
MTDISLNTNGTLTLYHRGKKVMTGTIDQIVAHLKGPDAPKTKPKKVKPPSRATRWADAAADAVAALETLKAIQEDELEPWKDGLPENLQSSELGNKLDTICGIDISSALEAAEEAESADMPLGFGRD